MQGTLKVLDLKTGIVRKPRKMTVLPIPDSVIKLVNDYGRK